MDDDQHRLIQLGTSPVKCVLKCILHISILSNNFFYQKTCSILRIPRLELCLIMCS